MTYYTYLRKSSLKAKIFFRIDEAAQWLGVSHELFEGDDESPS